MAIMPILGHFSQLYGLAGSSLLVSSGLTHGAASEGEVLFMFKWAERARQARPLFILHLPEDHAKLGSHEAKAAPKTARPSTSALTKLLLALRMLMPPLTNV